MLIINAYFDSCNMDATSGANALIVNDSRVRGGEVKAVNVYMSTQPKQQIKAQ